MRAQTALLGVLTCCLLCGPVLSFDIYNLFTNREEPWNVCAAGLCNCEDGVLAAMTEGLDCSYQKITGLADDMIVPLQYTKVDFSGNTISAVLPTTFFSNNTHIKRLFFSANNLETVKDDTFQILSSLEELDLGNNKIHDLSVNSFSGLKNLTRLDLSYNLLTALPEEVFADTPGLRSLILNFNPIKSLPDSLFSNMVSLRTLELSSLHLATLQPGLFRGLKVAELGLASNQLRAVPTKPLYELADSLMAVDLSGNPIQELSSYSFYNLPRLEKVTLEQMARLRSIESAAFCELPRLNTVVLRYLPKITYIDEGAFTSIQNASKVFCPVQDFTLSHSIMTSLPEHLLNWQEVKYLNLHNNRWRCDCDFAWVKGSPVEEIFGHDFYCSAPPRVRGSQLNWLTRQDFECRPEDYSRSLQWAVVGGLLVAGTLVSLLTVAVLFYRRHGYLFRPPRAYDQLANATSVDSITVYDVAPRTDAATQRRIDDATS